VALVALDVPDTPERYEVLVPAATDGAQVTRVTREERWTWSLFATSGRFSNDVIESDPRPVSATWRWTERDPPSPETQLWIVLRDGRGGVAWCHSALAGP
jgi:hypothetical protein